MTVSSVPTLTDRGQGQHDVLRRAPIGVFDSGIGGLSVVRALQTALPNEDIIYFADTANCPYGQRDEHFIRSRTLTITRQLVESGAKLVIVACNTACAVALDATRSALDVPVVGLEPAVKPAAALTKSGRIGVFATQRTIGSIRLASLIGRHAAGIEVELVAAPGWVEEVECGVIDRQRAMLNVASLVQPVVERGADVLVLGCTHYPFLEPLIREAAGDRVHIVDSGDAIARRARTVLEQTGLLVAESANQGNVTMITSSTDVASVQHLASRLLNMPLEVQFSRA